MGPTYTHQLQAIVKKYQSASQPWPASSHEMALWAIDKQLWAPKIADYADRLADDMARAMREEYIADSRGRKVRAKHAARVERDHKQLSIWDDIRTGSPQHMQVAFRQRREQIVGDCYQLKVDIDFYNEVRKPAMLIQLALDYTRDVQERELEGEV